MSSSIEVVKRYVEDCHQCFVDGERAGSFIRENDMFALQRKHKNLQKRKAEIVKNIVDGYIVREQKFYNRSIVDYGLTLQHVIKQCEKLYIEEQIQLRRAVIEDGEVIDDYQIHRDGVVDKDLPDPSSFRQVFNDRQGDRSRVDYNYDRLAVVRYAERWWNDFNPEYKKFENDCTNFISQCLQAGGAPMIGHPDRANGWWYRNKSWSYSWTVAHALRWYFSGAKTGLQAREVSSADELMRGDIICYDFNGDGRWDHTTVVVAKDGDGFPLVNAHTANSRMRYWAYEDSTAWTENIKYKFFHILDKQSNT
ncbi:amidase domain-containing protein [Evansella sp. AB-rgal1]|uniref:amidase domain-containing protein n=1 Tax=Evansella sp. AB-rgal1 TaxID=3242696 RepID=UPI00359DB24B